MRDWKSLTSGPEESKPEREAGVGGTSKDKVEQDAAILKSLWGDDVKIRQGQALMKPSEIRNRTPGRKRAKDWGECPLTFDKIKEPVRAGDGKVYERWAIKKWLEENNNRSPLTNTNIGPTLVPLTDEDEGTVFGERTEVTAGPDAGSKKNEIKTEINTVLNAVRHEINPSAFRSPFAIIPLGRVACGKLNKRFPHFASPSGAPAVTLFFALGHTCVQGCYIIG